MSPPVNGYGMLPSQPNDACLESESHLLDDYRISSLIQSVQSNRPVILVSLKNDARSSPSGLLNGRLNLIILESQAR